MKKALIAVGVLVLVVGGAFAYLRIREVMERGPAPTEAEIKAMIAARGRLRDEFRALLDQHNVLDFAEAPAGNVLVGVPTAFVEDLVGQMVSGVFSEVRLRLTNIKAHAEGDVRAKVIFTQTVGHYTLDVNVAEVKAILRPGDPQLKFGGDKVGIRLPVSVAEGRGSGTVHFQWEGKGLAGTVCGDLDVSPDVSSGVTPATYTVGGEFRLAAEGESVVARPRFPEIVLKVVLKPGDDTWAKLAATVEDIKDDKNGICRMAIQKIDVRGLVQKIIDKGFDVKLPPKIFKEISLPATVEQSLDIQGHSVTLGAKPIGLRVTPFMVWYGADLGATPKK